jgi:hypothetical protein
VIEQVDGWQELKRYMIADIENVVLSIAVLAISVGVAIAFSHLFLLGMSRFLLSNRRR